MLISVILYRMASSISRALAALLPEGAVVASPPAAYLADQTEGRGLRGSAEAFTALSDAMRKAITAHKRSRGYHVTRGPGAHAKTGEYARAGLDHLGIDSHLDEFDALRDLRNQSEYEALSVNLADVHEAFITSRRLSKQSRAIYSPE